MRVCVIGNSHAGPVAAAFRALPEAASLPWSFHSVPNGFRGGLGLRAVQVDTARRVLTGLPARDGATQEIEVEAFDAFVLLGGQPSAYQHRGLLEARFSAQFRERALTEMFRGCLNFHILGLLRQVTPAPVWCAASYLPSFPDQAPDRAVTDQAAERLRAFWAGEGVTFLDQPESLRDSRGWTPASARVSDENAHLRPEAAALHLAQIRAALGV